MIKPMIGTGIDKINTAAEEKSLIRLMCSLYLRFNKIRQFFDRTVDMLDGDDHTDTENYPKPVSWFDANTEKYADDTQWQSAIENECCDRF
jgi:hypothetical protein